MRLLNNLDLAGPATELEGIGLGREPDVHVPCVPLIQAVRHDEDFIFRNTTTVLELDDGIERDVTAGGIDDVCSNDTVTDVCTVRGDERAVVGLGDLRVITRHLDGVEPTESPRDAADRGGNPLNGIQVRQHDGSGVTGDGLRGERTEELVEGTLRSHFGADLGTGEPVQEAGIGCRAHDCYGKEHCYQNLLFGRLHGTAVYTAITGPRFAFAGQPFGVYEAIAIQISCSVMGYKKWLIQPFPLPCIHAGLCIQYTKSTPKSQ